MPAEPFGLLGPRSAGFSCHRRHYTLALLRHDDKALLLQTLKQRVISMERPKGATEKSQHGCFIQGGVLRSYCPAREEIPRRFALLTPAKLRRNDIVLLLLILKAKTARGFVALCE